MKKCIPLLVLSFFLISCSRHGIIKATAFVKRSVAGTIRVDEKGRPLNSGITTQHLIYVETQGTQGSPEWQTVWVDQQPFSVTPVEIRNRHQVIGRTPEGKEVVLHPRNGRQLWQLVLTPKKELAEGQDLLKKIKDSKILLTGTWKGKFFTYKIQNEKALEQAEFQ